MPHIGFGIIHLVRTLDSDVTLRQLAALALLMLQARPLNVREVATGLQIHKPATSRALVALERRGWIIRTQGEADRRDVLVAITDSGQAAMTRIVQALDMVVPAR